MFWSRCWRKFWGLKMSDKLEKSGLAEKDTSQAAPLRRRRAASQPPVGPARFSTGAAVTMADSVYQQLYQAIVTMELVPGTPISENVIAQEKGVSRTPVREAILRLTKERLVEVVPKSGSFVARIPVASLSEAIVIRRALEAVTVKAAVKVADPSQIKEFRAIIERQKEAAKADDTEAFHRADEEFHAALATVGQFQGIWDLIRQVKIQVDRYRRLTLPQAGRIETVIQEHESIVDALVDRDADLAVQRMEKHLDNLQLDIAVFRDMWPTYFIHDNNAD